MTRLLGTSWISALDGSLPRALRWLELSMVAALLLPTAFFVAAAWSSYEAAIDQANTRIDRATRTGKEHAARMIETNLVIVRTVRDMLGADDNSAIRAREPQLHLKLQRIVEGIAQIQSVWVWDADGRPLVSNRFHPPPARLDVSDRRDFRWAREDGEGWYVTETLTSSTSGEPFFDFVVARRREDGAFQGAISVSLLPAHFASFYRQLAEDDPGMVFLLVHASGAVIARWPEGATERLPASSPLLARIASDTGDGAVTETSAIDGVQRLLAFRKLDRYPLYVAAGIDRQRIIAGWYHDVGRLALFAFPTAFGLMFVAWLAMRRTRGELATLQKLQAETEQRLRAEAALRQSQKLEAVGRLTGGVAHDFNNLLMVVNNNLHVLRLLQPALIDNAQVAAMSRAVSSGEKLTRQLLAFARRQALRPEVIRLQERLPGLLDLVRPVLGGAIELSAAVEPDTAAIEVDPAELELAVLNLAINAKDAMPDGGRVAIIARNAIAGEVPGERRDYVALAVSDTGAGIPDALQEQVFEPFFTTKPSGQGTGLGLSQVYGLCAQAGGTARIRSKVGVGTTVLLYFAASEKPPEAIASGTQTATPRLDARVLLVEDNADVAGATKPLLEALGCAVVHTWSGDAAAEILAIRAAEFDAVLTDIAMPGSLDGLALARHVQRRHPRLPVVLMTGYAAELRKASELAFEVLQKPCSPGVLVTALRKAMAVEPHR